MTLKELIKQELKALDSRRPFSEYCKWMDSLSRKDRRKIDKLDKRIQKRINKRFNGCE